MYKTDWRMLAGAAIVGSIVALGLFLASKLEPRFGPQGTPAATMDGRR